MKTLARKQEQAQKPASTMGYREHPLLHLQHTIGNGAVVQTKLTVNEPGDAYEQEADRISDQVMRLPEPLQCAGSCDGEVPDRQTKRQGRESARVQAKGIESCESGLTEAPPIVHKVLSSPGQPLDPATRAFMEPRFDHDFSKVQVHTDQDAAQSAEAMAAQAYTVGADIVFGNERYRPASRDGQRLLAHELAHVLQQRPGSTLQRQPLAEQQFQTIPTELLSSVDIERMSDRELTDRQRMIVKVLGQCAMSTSDTDLLEREATRIETELARREALAAGRTFSEGAIKGMKDYFVQNAQKPAKPPENPPPEPRGGWQDSCIIALNKGMKVVTNKPGLSTTPERIEETMKRIAKSGHSGEAREVWFENRGGKITRGSTRPEKLQGSIWDTVMSLAGGDPGWSVFTMSIDDGNHSVTLTLDSNDPGTPRLYWSDQWNSKGGWKEYTRSELDNEVTRLVQGWWDKQKEGRKFDPVVRVWRVSATPQKQS